MLPFDDQPLSERLAGVIGNTLGVVFLVGLTAFSGFCFVFGALWTLVLVVFVVRAWLLGVPQNGDPAAFLAVALPLMVVYEYVMWRLFWFGWRFLRGDPREGDPFDADGQPK